MEWGKEGVRRVMEVIMMLFVSRMTSWEWKKGLIWLGPGLIRILLESNLHLTGRIQPDSRPIFNSSKHQDTAGVFESSCESHLSSTLACDSMVLFVATLEYQLGI